MKKRIHLMIASALCGLALSLMAAPAAHAQSTREVMYFYADEAQDVRIQAGSSGDAQQIASLFSKTIHTLSCNMWWRVYTVDWANKTTTPLIVAKEMWRVEGGKWAFRGSVEGGPFAGAEVTGTVYVSSSALGFVSDVRVAGRGTDGGQLDVNFFLPLHLYDYDRRGCF
jgi:hypothetical protein